MRRERDIQNESLDLLKLCYIVPSIASKVSINNLELETGEKASPPIDFLES